MNSDDPFAALEACATGPVLHGEPGTTPEAPKPVHFTEATDITVITANYYDNGAKEKLRFDSSQHAMNIQFFTDTVPFTPSQHKVDWEGTTQLHDPDYFDRKLYDIYRNEPGKITDQHFQVWQGIIKETVRMPKCESGPLLGVFVNKGRLKGGTHYFWHAAMRLSWNGLGDLKCEMMLDGRTFTISDFASVSKRLGRKDPDMRGRYDPNGLWVSKRKEGRA